MPVSSRPEDVSRKEQRLAFDEMTIDVGADVDPRQVVVDMAERQSAASVEAAV